MLLIVRIAGTYLFFVRAGGYSTTNNLRVQMVAKELIIPYFGGVFSALPTGVNANCNSP